MLVLLYYRGSVCSPNSAVLVEYGGAGRHIEVAHANELSIQSNVFEAMQFIYVPSVTLPKLSILALYIRIFATRGYRYTTYAIGIFIILVWLASLATAFAECKPFTFGWDKSIPNGRCMNLYIPLRSIGGLNILSDLFILVLPLHVIWHLHTSFNQKIGLTITFLTGSV